jgi:hypothetical protein
MKVLYINELKLLEEIKKMSFQYEKYIEWLDSDSIEGYLVDYKKLICEDEMKVTRNVNEKFDFSKSLKSSVEEIGETWRQLFVDNTWLVFHEYKQMSWIPQKYVYSNYANSFRNELIENGVDISSIDKIGGFRIVGDLSNVLSLFFQYSYIFSYRDIDVLNSQSDILIKIDHHLGLSKIERNT